MGNEGGKVSAKDRSEIIALITEAVKSGARKFKACKILDLEIRTIERWMKWPEDRRHGPYKKPSNALTEKERAKVLKVANSAEYANLTPWQIVPRLADNGEYIASESSFYRILKAEKMGFSASLCLFLHLRCKRIFKEN